jgi:hypothetical protein
MRFYIKGTAVEYRVQRFGKQEFRRQCSGVQEEEVQRPVFTAMPLHSIQKSIYCETLMASFEDTF